MNPSEKEMLLHRFIDGELDKAEHDELERRLETDPELRSELASLRQLGDALRTRFPAEQEPPSADFFNAHILRQIEREAMGQQQKHAAVERGRSAGWSRFSWPVLPWAIAVASLVLALVLGLRDRGGAGIEAAVAMSERAGRSSVGATYTPMEGVRVDAFFSDDAGATVIRLAGLDEIPAEREIVGHAAVAYRPGLAGDPIKLHDGSGRLLLSMVSARPRSSLTFF